MGYFPNDLSDMSRTTTTECRTTVWRTLQSNVPRWTRLASMVIAVRLAVFQLYNAVVVVLVRVFYGLNFDKAIVPLSW